MRGFRGLFGHAQRPQGLVPCRDGRGTYLMMVWSSRLDIRRRNSSSHDSQPRLISNCSSGRMQFSGPCSSLCVRVAVVPVLLAGYEVGQNEESRRLLAVCTLSDLRTIGRLSDAVPARARRMGCLALRYLIQEASNGPFRVLRSARFIIGDPTRTVYEQHWMRGIIPALVRKPSSRRASRLPDKRLR